MNGYIEKLSKELKDYIKKYSHQSFVAQCCYLCNAHWCMQSGSFKLHSPVRTVNVSCEFMSQYLSSREINDLKLTVRNMRI